MEKNMTKHQSSPYILSNHSIQSIMVGVILCLLPTLIASTVIFGLRAFLLTLFTVVTCVLLELGYTTLLKKPSTIKDGSAIITGMILAFSLPSIFPFWMAFIGAFISIILVKQLFGGLGHNFLNPALIGHLVLQISFPEQMNRFKIPISLTGNEVISSASLSGEDLPILDLLFGTHIGNLGATCILGLLLGGLILLFTKTITPAIPLVSLGSIFVFKFILECIRKLLGGYSALEVSDLLYTSLVYLFTGSIFLIVFFMATDYVTSPYGVRPKIYFAIVLSFFIVVFREFFNMNDGSFYALLLVNIFVPFFNHYCIRKPLGVVRKVKKYR